MPKNSSHCLVSLSLSPTRLASGSFTGFFRFNCFWRLSQKTPDFIAVALLARAASRSLRSLLTIDNLLGAVLAFILFSMTVSASLPRPANKTSRFAILSNWLLSRGPVPSKMISPFSRIALKYLLIIQHNCTSLFTSLPCRPGISDGSFGNQTVF